MVGLKVLFNELVRLQIELWDAVDRRLRSDSALPLSRFEPMQVIASHSECRVQDIAQGLSITVGGASKLVDRIEASGHCRRRANQHDRRSSIIELTDGGRGLLAEATTAFEDELAVRLHDAITEQQSEQLVQSLRQLRAALVRGRPRT